MFLPSTYLFYIGLGPQSGRYGGPPGIFGNGGAGHAFIIYSIILQLILSEK